MTLLFVTLWKLELTSKHAREQLGRLRRGLERERDAAPRTATDSVAPASAGR